MQINPSSLNKSNKNETLKINFKANYRQKVRKNDSFCPTTVSLMHPGVISVKVGNLGATDC